MTSLLYADVLGGAAGDMLLAALLDAGAPEDEVRVAVESVLAGRLRFRTTEVRRAGIRARLLQVHSSSAIGPVAAGVAGEGRPLQELISTVEESPLPPGVRARALAVLARLGEAEARVHGTIASAVHVHALGDDDTLLDVVGVAAALDALGIERIDVSPIPLGAGGPRAPAPVEGPHGDLPLPAPATLELLRGFVVRGQGRARRSPRRGRPSSRRWGGPLRGSPI